MLIDERNDARAGLSGMGLSMMAAAVFLPDGFEGAGDFVVAVDEQTGEAEVAEGMEELDLLGA